MIVAFRIDYRSHAECDIKNAERTLARKGLKSLALWRRRLVATLLVLELDPHRFPEAYEAETLSIDLREALFGQRPHIYRVLFTIEGSTVDVHGVRHASMDWITDLDI